MNRSIDVMSNVEEYIALLPTAGREYEISFVGYFRAKQSYIFYM